MSSDYELLSKLVHETPLEKNDLREAERLIQRFRSNPHTKLDKWEKQWAMKMLTGGVSRSGNTITLEKAS